jgi:hypothetical protein
MTFHAILTAANKNNSALFNSSGTNLVSYSSPFLQIIQSGGFYYSYLLRTKTQFQIAYPTIYVNSNNYVIPNIASQGGISTIECLHGYHNNYILVNNDNNNWNITLPDRPLNQSATWPSSAFQLLIKKTGSGTLTIQTPSDIQEGITRGINSKNNKSYILNSSNPQSVTITYVDKKDENGNEDLNTEIWYILKNKTFNSTHSNGSLLFTGTSSSYLTVTNDEDFRFGTGDFTIEWWQYQTDSNANPRIFSMGTYPTASIGVSIEGGTFYFWINGSPNSLGSAGTYKNVYTHFAIVRSGTTIKVFKNGTQLGSNITSSYDFNDSTNDLRIGNEQSITSSSAFGGNIKGFHWVKGTALYSSTFTPNYNSITPHANSKLLLNVANSAGLVTDSSGLNKTVTNTGVTFSTITHPFY